jgi:hypothetical protein
MSLLLPDESFHSLLLRYYLRNGDYSKILKGVISPLGLWKPFALLDIADFYLELPENVRFELIKKTLISDCNIYRFDADIISFNIISRHKKIDFEYSRVFRNGFVRSDFNRKIQYCQKCMIESIHLFGVAYFKKDWLSLKSHHCIKHNSILEKVTVNKGEKVLNPLLRILAGRYVKSSESNNIAHQNKNRAKSSLREVLKNSTPCLWQETISFIQSFIIQISDQYELKHLRGAHKHIFNIIMTPKRKLKMITWSKEVILLELMEKAFEVELKGFLSKNALPSTNLRIMPDSTSLKYSVNKVKNAKCDACTVSSLKCLNSLKIEFLLKDESLERHLIKKGDLNLLHHRDYKFQTTRI